MHASVAVDEAGGTVTIGHGTTVGAGAVLLGPVSLQEGCHIASNCVVGPHVALGSGTRLGAGVVVQHATIGSNVVVHCNSSIGQDGFGFHAEPGVKVKKPQELRVVLGDCVEIGANCAVDRGSWRDTVVGEGTKLDNLIQIGHNVRIGKHCLVAAQTGIAGSTDVGDGCLIGGQTGIAQHLHIGADAQIAAKSGVMADVAAGAKVGGTPAVPIRQFHRQSVLLKQLAQASPRHTTPGSDPGSGPDSGSAPGPGPGPGSPAPQRMRAEQQQDAQPQNLQAQAKAQAQRQR